MITYFLWAVLAVPVLISALTGPGPCHPYPGAVATDVLELIADNLNSEDLVQCDANTRRATISLRNGVITTTCPEKLTSVVKSEMVRRALTAIGTCALNDRGSISGYYIADDGSKTCYLYPNRESWCTP